MYVKDDVSRGQRSTLWQHREDKRIIVFYKYFRYINILYVSNFSSSDDVSSVFVHEHIYIIRALVQSDWQWFKHSHTDAACQHIRSSLGFSILLKDTLACSPGESNQQPSDNKKLARPLSHNHPHYLV